MSSLPGTDRTRGHVHRWHPRMAPVQSCACGALRQLELIASPLAQDPLGFGVYRARYRWKLIREPRSPYAQTLPSMPPETEVID